MEEKPDGGNKAADVLKAFGEVRATFDPKETQGARGDAHVKADGHCRICNCSAMIWSIFDPIHCQRAGCGHTLDLHDIL